MALNTSAADSIFRIVSDLLSLNLPYVDIIVSLCTNPTTFSAGIKEKIRGKPDLSELLQIQWKRIPEMFKTSLQSASTVLQKLLEKRVRMIPGTAANVKFNNQCDPVNISDLFGILGFVVAAHAHPMMDARTLAGDDYVWPFLRLLFLYETLCRSVDDDIPRPGVIQITWIRNPGDVLSQNSALSGCIGLGCNVHVTTSNAKARTLRQDIVDAKLRELRNQWPEVKGMSPLQKDAENEGSQANPTEWMSTIFNAKWPDEPHTSQYQIGVLAIRTEILMNPRVYERNSELLAKLVDRYSADALIKEMCKNCTTLAYQIIGADVYDFALSLAGVIRKHKTLYKVKKSAGRPGPDIPMTELKCEPTMDESRTYREDRSFHISYSTDSTITIRKVGGGTSISGSWSHEMTIQTARKGQKTCTVTVKGATAITSDEWLPRDEVVGRPEQPVWKPGAHPGYFWIRKAGSVTEYILCFQQTQPDDRRSPALRETRIGTIKVPEQAGPKDLPIIHIRPDMCSREIALFMVATSPRRTIESELGKLAKNSAVRPNSSSENIREEELKKRILFLKRRGGWTWMGCVGKFEHQPEVSLCFPCFRIASMAISNVWSVGANFCDATNALSSFLVPYAVPNVHLFPIPAWLNQADRK
ncbi:hypothetical protein B0H15DRAFT_993884 [Mycena belliarum]|uniref:Uncharacterized protein n=1 Tax=Mycena belliarum TaxID=1033014 RepID=A0AAD6U2I8_9AGAR|nr:hypothetical protein B0H15DRAFT_993884 [Mycena belliae]